MGAAGRVGLGLKVYRRLVYVLFSGCLSTFASYLPMYCTVHQQSSSSFVSSWSAGFLRFLFIFTSCFQISPSLTSLSLFLFCILPRRGSVTLYLSRLMFPYKTSRAGDFSVLSSSSSRCSFRHWLSPREHSPPSVQCVISLVGVARCTYIVDTPSPPLCRRHHRDGGLRLCPQRLLMMKPVAELIVRVPIKHSQLEISGVVSRHTPRCLLLSS